MRYINKSYFKNRPSLTARGLCFSLLSKIQHSFSGIPTSILHHSWQKLFKKADLLKFLLKWFQDLSTDEDGHLQVTLEGIGLKFETRRVSCGRSWIQCWCFVDSFKVVFCYSQVHIDLCHIRNCSTQGGVFLLEEYGELGFSCFGAVTLPPRKCEINEHKGMEVVQEVGFEVVVWILLVGSLHVGAGRVEVAMQYFFLRPFFV